MRYLNFKSKIEERKKPNCISKINYFKKSKYENSPNKSANQDSIQFLKQRSNKSTEPPSKRKQLDDMLSELQSKYAKLSKYKS